MSFAHLPYMGLATPLLYESFASALALAKPSSKDVSSGVSKRYLLTKVELSSTRVKRLLAEERAELSSALSEALGRAEQMSEARLSSDALLILT